MKNKLQALLSIGCVLSCMAAWAQSSLTTDPMTETEVAALHPTRAVIEQGRNIAETACARCHNLDGIATDPAHPHLAGQRLIYLYRVMQAYQKGYRVDASMGHASGLLNGEGMLAVASWYSNQAPATAAAPAASAGAAAPGDDPFADLRPELRKCIKCHDETGNSSASGMPNLTAQDPAYFAHSMQAYASGDRNHKMMKKLAGNLDDETLRRMGVYYAVQQPQRSETRGEGDERAGRRLAEDCAKCHGDDGNAETADMPSLAGQDARYFVKAMNAYREGTRKHDKMFEAVEGLKAQDIQDLATFYAMREPARRNVRAPLTATEWAERCERCHGLDGNSTDPRFPMLAGQNPGYLRAALQSYAGKTRDNSTMHAMASPLSATDIESLVAHFASQQPKAVVYMRLPCEAESTE